MKKAVAYYRSRPSEPEASGLALRLQREAVREAVEEDGLDLIGEFTEREGESGTEDCPAYAAAAHMAYGQGELVQFIIASRAAIGSGDPFKEPDIKYEPPDDQDIFGQGYFMHELLTPSVEHASEITLPDGAPGPLCLYADFRPRQLDTLVYLCNATPEALRDVVVATERISMNDFNSKSDECWEQASRTFEQRWAAVPPGTCVQVAWLNHIIWDDVCRHCPTYADMAGQRWAAEAHDSSFTPYWLAQDPDNAWVALSPARAMDQAAPGSRPWQPAQGGPVMSRHNYGRSPRPWSKLKSRVEALFAPGLPLAIHCNVFVKVTKEFTFDEPRHWVMLGHGRAGRIIWDFPGPFLRPAPGKPPRSTRGPPLDYWETGYGCSGRRPSEPSALMRDYLDRPRDRLMEPFEDPWELAAILRAADRRLGRACLLGWAANLDPGHPALIVVGARFGLAAPVAEAVPAWMDGPLAAEVEHVTLVEVERPEG